MLTRGEAALLPPVAPTHRGLSAGGAFSFGVFGPRSGTRLTLTDFTTPPDDTTGAVEGRRGVLTDELDSSRVSSTPFGANEGDLGVAVSPSVDRSTLQL